MAGLTAEFQAVAILPSEMRPPTPNCAPGGVSPGFEQIGPGMQRPIGNKSPFATIPMRPGGC